MRLWKKASSLILAVALCFCLLPVQAADAGGDQGSSGSGPVFRSFKSLPLTLQSNQVGISVNTTRTDAYSGDVISFEVVMDPVQNLGTLQLVLDIPDGLSYVPDSACVPDDLKTTLGFDELAFTELSLMLNGYASAGNYSAEAETLLLTFDCKADDTVTAQATVNVSLTNLEFYSIGEDEEDWLDLTDSFEVIPAPLTLHPGTHTHSYTGTVTTPASCTTAGIKTYVCACGERYTEDVPALGHTWDDGVITTQPTATTEGVKTFTCEVCHETKTESVPVLEEEIPEDAPVIRLAPQKLIKGNTVGIDVELVNNPGIISAYFNVVYDSSVLTLTGFSLNESFGGMITDPPSYDSPARIIWDNTALADSTYSGVIGTLLFTVSDTTEAESTTVSINYTTGDISNLDEDDVRFYTEPAVMEIIDYIPGDINGDGAVNSKDVTRLRKYLANWDVEVVTKALDVNGDGAVNSKDVTRLRKYLANWDVEVY